MILPLIEIVNEQSAYNDAFGVYMPQTWVNDQSWLGVLAQEVFEWRYSWAHPIGAFFGGVEFDQALEIHSHMVEAVVATQFDGREFGGYMDLMVSRLDAPTGYRERYGMFKGMNAGDLRQAMYSNAPDAQNWANKHADFFRAWKAKKPA